MKKSILPGFLVFSALYVILLCGSSAAGQTRLLDGAVWITDRTELPVSDSLFYLDHPAPLMKTDFDVSGDIQKAEMHITAAGYYESWLNGKRVGDQQIDPAWTNFSKRVYVTTIDVTSLIHNGMNSWGIMLGNGFFNPLPLRMWGGRNIRTDLPVGKPCAIATLEVTLKDGTKKVYSTNDQWVTKPGPVVRNSVYLGEWYDARKETVNWNKPGSGKDGWEPVKVVEGPGGKPESADFPPIRVTRWLEPVSITGSSPSKQVVDFGQNFAGLIRVNITAGAGDTIRFRYGEQIYKDGSVNPMTTVCGQIKRAGTGGPGAPAVAEQTDVYIANGSGHEVFQTRFTFHGFRYVEVTGLKKNLLKQDIKAGRMSTSVENAGRIMSSSAYLNKLNENCQWTFLSNLQSVQSDCPAREKFGYGGDINATADAYIYNFDMHDIYRKVIRDWADAMKPNGFVDTAPFVGIEYCGLSWESAFLFLQNALLVHYGDRVLVKEFYKMNVEWMAKVAKLHPNLVVDSGLSDHESLAKVPVQLTGTCHYYQIAKIMERFAAINGDTEGKAKYKTLAENIRLKIIDLFWDTPQIAVENKQTLLASLIYSDVLQGADRQTAVDQLLDVLKTADYHVTTGIFGTKYLLDVLSGTGHTDIAWKVVNQSGFPGWKYMIDNGATTVWETWKESDNTFSQNHPMFGSVSEWYIKWLGGIQPDFDNPSLTRAVLKPRPVAGLDSLSVEKYFTGGRLTSRWWWKGNDLLFGFTVPTGLTTSWVPAGADQKILVEESPGSWTIAKNRNQKGISLNIPGKYVFQIKNQKL